MKKIIQRIIFGSALLLFVVACTEDINDQPKLNLRAISAFSFETYYNSAKNIAIQHLGVIDEVNKTIKVKLPSDVILTGLRPSITLSPWTTSSPSNLELVDFTKDTIDITVTAQSGKKAVYSVIRTLDYLYTKAEVYSVSFPDFISATTGDPIKGTFATFSNNSAVTVNLPTGTDLSSIQIILDLSPASRNATFEVSEDGTGALFRPFTNPGVVNMTKLTTLRVKPQSGTAINYKITAKNL